MINALVGYFRARRTRAGRQLLDMARCLAAGAPMPRHINIDPPCWVMEVGDRSSVLAWARVMSDEPIRRELVAREPWGGRHRWVVYGRLADADVLVWCHATADPPLAPGGPIDPVHPLPPYGPPIEGGV